MGWGQRVQIADVKGRAFTCASIPHSTVANSSSSSDVLPSTFLNAVFTDRTKRSQYPPHHGARGVMYFHSILFDVNVRWVSRTNSFKFRPISLNDVDRVGRKIGQEPAKTVGQSGWIPTPNGLLASSYTFLLVRTKGRLRLNPCSQRAKLQPLFLSVDRSSSVRKVWRFPFYNISGVDRTASDLLLHANVECVDLSLTALLVGVDLTTELDTWCGTVGQSVVNVHQLEVFRCHQRTVIPILPGIPRSVRLSTRIFPSGRFLARRAALSSVLPELLCNS
ncbi:hypothetical protein T11_5217 [Trichinella zimbabwensis]|uniref:Uncharacterized protein n=1 Tax=Trichinella zimbabwensis TaxID=268475 RepID=A0A0V1H9V8_9BILA|nr:hypothetical protein T11_5217 [Trichinella zimbabwensis]